MKTMIHRGIRSFLHRFGYDLERTGMDPFEVQRLLIPVKSPVIFDIGAHFGETATQYRRIYPKGIIHCFEPSPDSIRAFRANIREDPRIMLHPYAVGDQPGASTLHVNKNSGTNSLLASSKDAESYWGKGLLETVSTVTVDTTTVDMFCEENKIPHIDILKMDVQGGEYGILLGAKGMLSRHRVSLIFTEIILCPTYDGQHPVHEYLGWLDGCGYKLYGFYRPIWRGMQLLQSDFIFIPK
jgi:FkbM family methyltransferase